MAELFNQGYNAVKAVSSTSQVIIHLDDAGIMPNMNGFLIR